MTKLRIAFLQIAPAGTLSGNLEKGISACKKARSMGAPYRKPWAYSDLTAPEGVTVRSEEELVSKLEESRRDIAEGRPIPADEAFLKLKRKFKTDS
ncbi:MAG: hypothetical protein IJ737_01085 [Ruminococcus sp.]|nr:hypothetical protein [Ruminococcus sp.]